ncbi:proline dehydrogenase family protein [Stackebrandtia nassauensis]|uniref:proline dehydrogenase n=1 Tax=Stackebrandtia nassauensis (strain DSM 44728 / CIP 108903 / NRRL B-16338 / NBRC 102104 / LLR-40K-21) TaxID=446470 RepID=D3PY61_STANL|nr:proline dehydrogenase family protein [Stackebrandtia nassauensis]ADD45390.1 Proline dehydrogenase [Stackebrandtia nassauensis DSM 44728]
MLRSIILAAARSSRLERLTATAPVSRNVVKRYVAGTDTNDALRTSRELVDSGLKVSLDYLGEDTLTTDQAESTRDEYLKLLSALKTEGLTPATEVSIKLSALGQRFDEELSLSLAEEICTAAADADTTVTVDMEDHTTTDITLDAVGKLRQRFSGTGAVLQSYLRRTEADCREFAVKNSRVRLCKGAYAEPESVAYQNRLEVDRSYVRCVNTLMSGEGYPMLATHDPRLVEIAIDRAKWYDRGPHSFEFQMLYGIRPDEQRRLAEAGYQVRVYVPFGDQWYGYLMRRLAERPANLRFFMQSLKSRK